MAIAKRATTIIVTAETPEGTHLLLNATDPRWRLDGEGKFGGVDALKGGVATSLTLANLKFIGGLVDGGESAEQAGLRELREEAGKRLADAVEKFLLEPVYTMVRPLEWNPTDEVEITYLHAHIKADSLQAVRGMIEPHDDCFGIAIVKTDQIAKTDLAYVVAGRVADENIIFRPDYVEIPYRDWEKESGKPIPQAARDAFDFYNANGPTNPLVGIDTKSLRDVSIKFYTPKDISPTANLSEDQVTSGHGGAVPDGAIFMQLVKPRLEGSMANRDFVTLNQQPISAEKLKM